SFGFLDHATTAVGSAQQAASSEDHDSSSLPTAHCPVSTVFWPVGNSDWYRHGEEKAPYDQQPVEAVTMAEAALAAFGLCSEEKYLTTFRRAHDWFHGQNSLRLPLVDARCGACCDGLQPFG